jgi:hypothetical protein
VLASRSARVDGDTGLAHEDITCEEYIRALADDLAGELSPDRRDRNRKHQAACVDCARYRSDYEAVVSASRASGSAADEPLPAGLVDLILSSRNRPH